MEPTVIYIWIISSIFDSDNIGQFKAYKIHHYMFVQLVKNNNIYLLLSGLWKACPPTHASHPTHA